MLLISGLMSALELRLLQFSPGRPASCCRGNLPALYAQQEASAAFCTCRPCAKALPLCQFLSHTPLLSA